MQKILFALLFSIIVTSFYVLAAEKSAEEIRKEKILKTLKCMTCAGQSVLDSESEFAKSLRDYVSEQIEQGKSNEQINSNLYERYGNEIFFKPPVNKQTILLWILPFFLIFVGFIAVVIFLKKSN